MIRCDARQGEDSFSSRGRAAPEYHAVPMMCAFMTPVLKNDWEIYNTKRSRNNSESSAVSIVHVLGGDSGDCVVIYIHRNVLSRLCVGIYGFIYVFYCVGVSLPSGPTFSFVYLLFYSVGCFSYFCTALFKTYSVEISTDFPVCFCFRFGTIYSDCYHVSSFLLIH